MGTQGAYAPFFSPDGGWVGFFAGGKLKKIQLDGSTPVILCDAPAGRGASWGEDGRIIAALDNRSGLSLVAADGGIVSRATELGPGEITHRMPQMLPGGKDVLFLVNSAPGSYVAASVGVASLGASPARARIVLPNVGMFPRYLPTGHVVYVANGTLYAVPFDVNRLEVRGTATAVMENISASVSFGFAQMDFSKEGHLLYRGGQASGRTVAQWLNADGAVEPLWAEPAFYQFPQLSPDGNRLLLVLADGANMDIWVYDPQRGTKTRLTAGTGVNSYPIWSADGRHVVFQLGGQLYWVSADGAERPQPLLKTVAPAFPASFTPDGRQLMFFELKPGGGSLIQTVPIVSESGHLKAGKPEFFRELSAGNPIPTVSPDGRWVAYASIESGVYEVYVRAFPDTGKQWAVSTGGGSFPVWSRTRNELFYRTEDQFLMVTSYSSVGDSFVAVKPRAWSGKRLFNTGLVQNFSLAPDGKRFAVLMSAESPEVRMTEPQAILMLNFFDEIRRRVATPRQ
jgi:serine/threonine-protein kinase